ncbi:phosphotriesterase [Curtobacterium sp. MWU13-2055]|uniref:phosphotriesterase family protein n=1 Tax=Curtobacterium sp. MWU13-2055 TaxID=2931928 RepID=UPI00200CDF77|nr:hypothetical protein [Curtobacterium sp. MWU13-2055]
MIQTVLGLQAAPPSGIVLPHEHLFNALPAASSPVPEDQHRDLVDVPVAAEHQWRLRSDPYCNYDNVAAKGQTAVATEVAAFAAVGGSMIVDVTGSAAIGRDPDALAAMARESGVAIVMATGPYLEAAQGDHAADTVDAVAAEMIHDLTIGVGNGSVRAGLIGEVGVSPAFTASERNGLIAAAEAHRVRPEVALMVHLPGWLRRGHEVLDVLEQSGVPADRIVLAHMDPSGHDADYQRSLADRGVWLEFDMIGMGITFPGEGRAPDPSETATAIAALVRDGHTSQILLSHDLFLKQMWTQHGGEGLTFVPSRFRDYLREHAIDDRAWQLMTHHNPIAMLEGSAP